MEHSLLSLQLIRLPTSCLSGPQTHLPHGLGMDEMIVAPDGGVIVVLPLQVDVQVAQVVTLRDCELLPDLIALLLSALGKERGIQATEKSCLRLSPTRPPNLKHINVVPDDIAKTKSVYNKIFILRCEGNHPRKKGSCRTFPENHVSSPPLPPHQPASHNTVKSLFGNSASTLSVSSSQQGTLSPLSTSLQPIHSRDPWKDRSWAEPLTLGL